MFHWLKKPTNTLNEVIQLLEAIKNSHLDETFAKNLEFFSLSKCDEEKDKFWDIIYELTGYKPESKITEI